jgi:hypothetical protein
MKKAYILTMVSVGLFIGFWLGYFVFSQVHIKIICRPSNKVLVDETRGLMYEVLMKINVIGCESIDLAVSKPSLTELIFGTKGGETSSQPSQPVSEKKGGVPAPPTEGPSRESIREAINTTETIIFPEPENATRAISLEIYDLCSANMTGEAQLSEETGWCLNKKYPYNIILEKNETHIKTSFYGETLNKTYQISDWIPIFRVFIQDFSGFGETIKSIEVYGQLGAYFKVGDYTYNNIWQQDPQTKIMSLVKIVASAPVSVDKNVPFTSDWSNLNFYLRSDKNIYYVGNAWVFVTQD